MKGLLCWLTLSVAVFGQHFSVLANQVKEVHASILYSAEMPLIGRKTDGGYARLSTALVKQRQNDKPVFFLFGGNSLGPSPMSTYDSGSHIVDILNSLEPDAMGIAKREYSYFEEQLSLRAYEAAFPMVATNIIDPINLSNQDGLVSSVIISKGKIKLGVLAVVAPVAAQQYLLKRVEILNIKTSLIKEAKALKQDGANVIAVMHGSQFSEITELLNDGVIDISLLKDSYFEPETNALASHTEIYRNHQVILNQPSEIAIIDITLKRHGKVEIQWSKNSLLNELEEPSVAKQRNDYLRRLNRLLDLPLTKVFEPFATYRKHVRTQENRFGNFVADAMLDFTQADAAIVNSGIIRGKTQYYSGHVFTRKDLAEELPFRTGLVVLEISGSDIYDTVEASLSDYESQKGKFPQVANMEIRFDSGKTPGNRLISLKIGGQAIQLKKTYRLATTDYLLSGGDGYTFLKNGKVVVDSLRNPALLSDLVMQKIITENRVGSPLSRRLVNLK